MASSVLMALARVGCPVTPRGLFFVLDGMLVLLKWVLESLDEGDRMPAVVYLV